MTNLEFASKAAAVAENYRTVYLKGVFGAPLSKTLLTRMKKQYPDFYTESKVASLTERIGDDPIFGFDCVCLVKGLLWGWSGDASATYGGASYESGGVPDASLEQLLQVCTDVGSDLSNDRLTPGELLYLPGHVGIYIGNGVSVEATTAWKGGVQFSSPVGCDDGGKNYPKRRFTKHGKLPYLTYVPTGDTSPGKSTLSLPVLSKGMKNETVRALQALLILRGFSPSNGGTDGSFGGATKTALTAFQKANGIPADGTCKDDSWKTLLGI